MRKISTKSQKNVNIKKVFDYLRGLEKFNTRHLWDEEEVSNGDPQVIWELLDDLWHFFTKRIVLDKNIKKPRPKSSANTLQTSTKKNKIPNNIPIPTIPKPIPKPQNKEISIDDDPSVNINFGKDIKKLTKNEYVNNTFVENIMKVKDISGYADAKKYQQVLTENISQILNTSHKNANQTNNSNQNRSTISHLKNLNIDTSRLAKNKK